MMKYFIVVFKLSLIFLLTMLHLSLIKQWVHSFSEQPAPLKSTTILPIMIHFVTPIPSAPHLPIAAPDKKSNVKMMQQKSEVKQQVKLKKLPILATQAEKPISPQKVQKITAPVQKNRPTPLAKAEHKTVVHSEKPVVAVKSTPPVEPKTEAHVAPAPSPQIEKLAAPASLVSSMERVSDSKGSSIAKNTTFPSNFASKTTSQATASVNQSQGYIPPNHRATYLHNPKPHYPEISQQLEEQGTVQLLVNVDSRGQVSQARIKHSSGYPRLDGAALQAVKQWQFIPAKQGIQPIAATTVVPITFRLNEE